MARILEPEKRLPLSNQDLLSYVFDRPAYDRTQSVRQIFGYIRSGTNCGLPDLHRRPQPVPLHIMEPGSNHHPPVDQGTAERRASEWGLCGGSLTQ